jgi:hypothetical protein
MRVLLVAAVLLCSPSAPAAAPDPKALVGVWEGTLTRVQAGRCSVGGQEKVVTPVRVIVRLDDKGQVVAGLTMLPAAVAHEGNVSIRVDKERIFLDQPVTAFCGETFKRKYVVKHEIGAAITPDGRRTLQLVGMDVPCIQSGCRFQNVFDLEFKGDPPAANQDAR